MSSLALTVSDTWVLARRNLKRIPRQPDLLIAYTIQPVMFTLLFVYVFGGAIDSGGFDYVDFLMQGIILSGQVPPGDAEILSRIWVAGIIPVMIGLGLIFNGLIVSKRLVKIAEREARTEPHAFEASAERSALRPADTSEFIHSDFSVTEETTKHLKSSVTKL